MARLRFSVRGLIIAVAVIGFDFAALSLAIKQGRLALALTEYLIGFGLVLLVLNLVILGLVVYFARTADRPGVSRLNSTPPPLVMIGLYMVVLAIAILSVLFCTSDFSESELAERSDPCMASRGRPEP